MITIKESNSNKLSFQEWLDWEYYEGFDPSGLSDDEYYELEDAYYRYLDSK